MRRAERGADAVARGEGAAATLPRIGEAVEVVIEVPRLSFVKRRPDGRVHFVSPLPSLFDYGSVPGTRAADGDPLDAIVLGGPRRRFGARARGRVLGVVRFVDHGLADPKLVVGDAWSALDRARIAAFFRVYARAKRWLDPGEGVTRFEGWER